MKTAIISDKIIDIDYADVDYFCSKDKPDIKKRISYDAAFLLEPFEEEAKKFWTGHPHLRQCSNEAELKAELDKLKSKVETERKYLIKYPDFEKLKKYTLYKSRIEQVYLTSDTGTHRIRKRSYGSLILYYETFKVRHSDLSASEFEGVITKEKYDELLKLADKEKRPIKKDRYCFFYKKQYFELDVFDFWSDKALVELELRDENQPVSLPPELELIKDVSDDYRYKNSFLARVKNEL